MKPTAFVCGVVEGFYGRPWSARQRGQLLAWMRAWGLNTYLYAPKDDLKHRRLWRRPYSPVEAAELHGLIRDCRRKRLEFVYALAPGLDLSYSGRKDRDHLRSKSAQLLQLGCRRFALLFDDVPPALPRGDSRRFHSIADAQSAVANELLGFLRERAPGATLYFCPTQYCERMSGPVGQSEYLRQIGHLLDASIQIFWTGPEIISETITAESVRALARVLRRKPLLWDNLHANDYDLRRIYLGSYAGRTLELRNEVAGILSNPNCEFEANYIPLRTLALFARAHGRWDPEKADRIARAGWLRLWKTGRHSRISARELGLLCDCFYLPHRHGRRAEAFLAALHALVRAESRTMGAIARDFARTCAEIAGLREKVAGLENRELVFALYRLVWELAEETALVRDYVNWWNARGKPNREFTPADRRPKIFRGGLVAELQRWLPMAADGRFRHRPFPRAAADSR